VPKPVPVPVLGFQVEGRGGPCLGVGAKHDDQGGPGWVDKSCHARLAGSRDVRGRFEKVVCFFLLCSGGWESRAGRGGYPRPLLSTEGEKGAGLTAGCKLAVGWLVVSRDDRRSEDLVSPCSHETNTYGVDPGSYSDAFHGGGRVF
jgi:hypothetical protein